MRREIFSLFVENILQNINEKKVQNNGKKEQTMKKNLFKPNIIFIIQYEERNHRRKTTNILLEMIF